MIRRNYYIIALMLLQILAAMPLYAQQPAEKTDRVLFILDGSADMGMDWLNGKTKFNAAAEVITTIIDSINQNNGEVEFGLRVYGHQFSRSVNRCDDSRIEVAYSKDNLAQTSLRLNDLKPKGTGSSVFAISKALDVDMKDTATYRYSIVLLQGNNESNCAGDNCTQLINSGKRSMLYRLYKIEFGDNATADRYCMDNVFEMTNTEAMVKGIQHIAGQFKVRKKVVTEQPAQSNNVVVVREVKKEILPKQKEPEVIIARADTNTTKIEQPVEIIAKAKKSSKIKVEDPSQYGEINLINISTVRQMKIYAYNGEVEKEIMDIYPVGLDKKLVRLPIGKYILLYTYGYSNTLKKLFEVLPEKILDIAFW